MRHCHNIDCGRKSRNREHHFCSECWFKVPAILKRRYYAAKYSEGGQLDRAITDIIRSLGRKDAIKPN